MLKRFLTAILLLATVATANAADWSKPVSTDTYLNVLTYLREKDTDLATMFSGGAPANLASESIRLNRATSPWQFERWTGSAWSAISVKAAAADTATSATSATSATNADTLDSQHGSYYTNYVLTRLGATSTSGVTDWNDATNTIPGTGPTLLMGTATNGPGPSAYFHAFNLEYGSTKAGTGNVTQLAVPYVTSTSITSGMYIRGRASGVWTPWYKFWTEGNDGPTSGLDAQTAATATTSTTATSAGKWTTARTLSLTGNVTGSASVDGSANAAIAATVVKLGTARTIALTGDVTGSASFDGSANATITATVADDSHSHSLPTFTAGDTRLFPEMLGTPATTSYTKVVEYYIPTSGTIRTTLTVHPLGTSEGDGTGSAGIYKNGVLVGSYTTTTTTADIAVSAGDLLQGYGKITAAPGIEVGLTLKASAPRTPVFCTLGG